MACLFPLSIGWFINKTAGVLEAGMGYVGQTCSCLSTFLC